MITKIIKNGLKLEYEGRFDEAVEYYMTNEYYFFDLGFHPYITLLRLLEAKKVYVIDDYEYDWYDYLRYGFSLRFVAVPNTEEAINYVLAVRTNKEANHILFYKYLTAVKYFRTRTLSAIFNYPVIPTSIGFTNNIMGDENLVNLFKNIAAALDAIETVSQDSLDEYNMITTTTFIFPKFRAQPLKEYKNELEKYKHLDRPYDVMLFFTSKESIYTL